MGDAETVEMFGGEVHQKSSGLASFLTDLSPWSLRILVPRLVRLSDVFVLLQSLFLVR